MAPTRVSLRQIATTPLSSFAPTWSSGNLTWTAGTAQNVNHSLGRVPYLHRCVFVCVTAHTFNGVAYAVGDEYGNDFYLDNANNNYGVVATRINASLIRITPFPIGGMSSTNWRIRIDLW